MVLFFTHIPFVVNHTIKATPPERLQHHFIRLQRHFDNNVNVIYLQKFVDLAECNISRHCGSWDYFNINLLLMLQLLIYF